MAFVLDSSVALAWLLNQDRLLGSPIKPPLERERLDLKQRSPHLQPRATAMISLFMQGGPSHIDLLDPKPLLEQYDGKPFPGTIKYDNAAQASSRVLASPWKFRKHGQSGIEVSELLPNLAEIIDDVCVIRSMHTGVNNHGQSIYALANGRTTGGHPVLGSWLCYGLGSVNQDLPAFVALPDPADLSSWVLRPANAAAGWRPTARAISALNMPACRSASTPRGRCPSAPPARR